MNEPETTAMDAILEPVRNRLETSPTAPAAPWQPASAERRQQEIGLVLDTIRHDIFTFQTNPGQDRTATERLLVRIATGVEVIRGLLNPPIETRTGNETRRVEIDLKPKETLQVVLTYPGYARFCKNGKFSLSFWFHLENTGVSFEGDIEYLLHERRAQSTQLL